MNSQRAKPTSVRFYFVDEAGDGVLFGRKGRIRIGTPGCSRFFILGLLSAFDHVGLANRLEDLRLRLLSDPYFSDVPSMQPEQKKTALAFHATDDLPEVRREVFALLREENVRFYAIVRDKRKVLEYVRQRGQQDPTYRYNPNELYDFLARRLFKPLLHKYDEYNVCFSKRGQARRTQALETALETAMRRWDDQHGTMTNITLNISARSSRRCPELQAVDYFLWALQRLYEKREDRYINYLWNKIAVVIDVDDTRVRQYGEYYSSRKPLSLASLPKEEPEDIGLPNRS